MAFLNEKDAKVRGIHDGDQVRIWNNRGKCVFTASVGDQVLEGVVVTQGLWANTPQQKYLVNSLTPDRLADMGGGATFFSGKVDIEKV